MAKRWHIKHLKMLPFSVAREKLRNSLFLFAIHINTWWAQTKTHMQACTCTQSIQERFENSPWMYIWVDSLQAHYMNNCFIYVDIVIHQEALQCRDLGMFQWGFCKEKMVWDDTIIKVSETARTGRINMTHWMSHEYTTASTSRTRQQQLL